MWQVVKFQPGKRREYLCQDQLSKPTESGKRIDIVFGAIILEDWGTVIDESVFPPQVDYCILRKGELVEL